MSHVYKIQGYDFILGQCEGGYECELRVLLVLRVCIL